MRRRISAAWAGCAGALLAVAPLASAAGARLGYSGSVQYATGSYLLDEPTEGLYLFSSLSLAAGAWQLRATVPVVLQSEPVLVVPVQDAAGTVPDGHTEHHPGTPTTTTALDGGSHSEIGWGDVFLRADLEVSGLRGRRPAVRLAAATKAPLATNPSLSTGRWDYGAGASLAERVGGSFVFADALYWMFGDPAGYELHDALAYGISVGHPLGKLGIMASVTGYTRIQDGVDPPVQVGGAVSYWPHAGRSLNAAVSFGVTDSAPDVVLSFGWGFGR